MIPQSNKAEKIVRFVKTIIQVGCAWSLIFTLVYFLLEASFFCCSSYLFPYAARVSAGFGIYPLLQTSKSSVAPEHYIAIFGDSYGFGEGDYFLQTQQELNPKFNATHFLHERTGRDFISFAIPGSSNLTGWIEDPISSLNYINSTLLYHLPDPEKIYLYFYEGNDTQGNLTDFQARYEANGYYFEKIDDEKYFFNFINNEILEKNQINIKSKRINITDNLFFKKYAEDAINQRKDFDIAMGYIKNLTIKNGIINSSIIDGKQQALPDNMSAPPIEVTASDLNKSEKFIDAITNYTKKYFKNSELSIIYIPSPLMTYKLTSKKSSIYNPESETIYSTQSLYESSNHLCNAIKFIAIKNSINFYDARPGIYKQGTVKKLHGDLDVGHFNLDGYKALADEIYNFSNLLEEKTSATIITPCVTLPLQP